MNENACEKSTDCTKEVQILMEGAGKNAAGHFKVGLTCSECVFQGWLDLGLTEYPSEVIALASGFGGGMGSTGHTCGAVIGGMMAIGTMKGRKNPFAFPTFEERKEELNKEDTGVYPRHGAFIRDVIKEWGTIECRDLCMPFEDFQSIERARNCKEIIKFCAECATKHAMKD